MRAGSGPRRLPAEHADAGGVDADEPPGRLLALHGQGLDKRVGGGAVRVPVLGVDASAPARHRLGVPALGLEKVLLKDVVVDVDLAQHRHLLALDVGGRGFVPDPHADAVAHRELPAVQHGVSAPPAPGSPVESPRAAEKSQIPALPGHRRGLRAEQHPGRAETPLPKNFGVHSDVYSFSPAEAPRGVAVGCLRSRMGTVGSVTLGIEQGVFRRILQWSIVL